MTEIHKQFEALPEIEEILKSEKWDFVDNDYIVYHDNELCLYVQGAWYAFQEQQKKIDSLLDHVCGSFEDFK